MTSHSRRLRPRIAGVMCAALGLATALGLAACTPPTGAVQTVVLSLAGGVSLNVAPEPGVDAPAAIDAPAPETPVQEDVVPDEGEPVVDPGVDPDVDPETTMAPEEQETASPTPEEGPDASATADSTEPTNPAPTRVKASHSSTRTPVRNETTAPSAPTEPDRTPTRVSSPAPDADLTTEEPFSTDDDLDPPLTEGEGDPFADDAVEEDDLFADLTDEELLAIYGVNNQDDVTTEGAAEAPAARGTVGEGLAVEDEPLAIDETIVGPVASVDIFRNARPVGAVLAVRTTLAVGARAVGSVVAVVGQGLKPGSVVDVLVYSRPQLIASGRADGEGSVSLTASIPSDLEAGVHTIEVRGMGQDDEVVHTIGAFEIDEDQTVTGLADPGQTTESITPDDPELQRALDAGAPIFDPARYPTMTAAFAVAGAAVVGLAGLAGFTSSFSSGARAAGGTTGGAARGSLGGSPRGTGGGSSPTQRGSGSGTSGARTGKRGRREDGSRVDDKQTRTPTGHTTSKTKLKGVQTRKLAAVDVVDEGHGDRSRTWRWPGTAAFDAWIAETANRSGRIVVLVPRLLTDGSWSRAMFGSMALAVWLAGVVLGLVAAGTVGFGPYPPALGLVIAIVVLSILDASAGTLAWLVLVIGACVTGQVTAWGDVRTLLGLFVLYAALPLIGHATRPLRREHVADAMGRFDRVCDYVVMPLLVAFAGAAMYKAINGLSGLELVNLDGAASLTIAIVLALWVRLALEDAALHEYPARTQQVFVEVTTVPSKPWALLSVAMRTAVLILVMAPFLGLGWATFLAATLLAVPMLLKVWRDELPNSPWLNKYTPRGLLRFSVLLVAGMLLSAWLLGRDASDEQVLQTYNLLLVPGILLGLLAIFGRKGGDWPETWTKRFAGGVVFVVTAAFVTGVLTIG